MEENTAYIATEASRDVHVLVVAHGSPIRELVHYLADDLECELPGGRETIAKTHNTCVSQFTVHMTKRPKNADMDDLCKTGASCNENKRFESNLQHPGDGVGIPKKLAYSISKVKCSLLNDKSHLGAIASTY